MITFFEMMSLFKKYYYSFQIDNNLSQIFQDNIRAFVFFRKDFNLLKYEDLGMILFSLNNNVSCFMIFYGSNDCVRYQVIFWIYEIKQRFLRSLSGSGRLRYSHRQAQALTLTTGTDTDHNRSRPAHFGTSDGRFILNI